MSVIVKQGDLFTCGADAITCTVNCVGIMGKGVALEFKRRYPKMFLEYVKQCKNELLYPGKVWVWHEFSLLCVCGDDFESHHEMVYDVDPEEYSCICGCINYKPATTYIVNFPTKLHWRDPSKLEWIKDGLYDLKNHVIIEKIKTLAMPALGCQNGGLRFEDVQPLVENVFGDSTLEVTLFEPQ